MDATDHSLLDAFLDSWDRNNTILVNLMRAVPDAGFDAKVMDGSPTVAKMLTHMHYVRLVFVSEDVPEFTTEVPKGEWVIERDRDRLAQMLNESAKAVRAAVRHKLETFDDMAVHYDHPILMVQHLIWHDGYHHAQIKLALKAAGHPLDDEEIGPLTWGIWMHKTS